MKDKVDFHIINKFIKTLSHFHLRLPQLIQRDCIQMILNLSIQSNNHFLDKMIAQKKQELEKILEKT